MDLLTYDSKDIFCKTPYGAVSSGTTVTFTLRPLRSAHFTSGTLFARFEFLDNQIRTFPLCLSGNLLDRELFSCRLDTEGYVGLIWYSFVLEGPD